MSIKKILKKIYLCVKPKSSIDNVFLKKQKKFAFWGTKCDCYEQYEACITRLYHTIEKGLSYETYRAGFGQKNVQDLLCALERYSSSGYDVKAFFYETALSTLKQYVEKNRLFGYEDPDLEKRISNLNGCANTFGGTIDFTPLPEDQVKSLGFADFIRNRHSIRHFSSVPVSLDSLKDAIKLAQFTPSACNRQGWKTRIIANKDLIKDVLKWQNGNRGFGQELDKLLLVTADVRCFNRDREVFQAFIDGGMYAANVLNALHYEHIGSIPLSASLTVEQENHVRKLLKLASAEVLILFIGVGSYPEKCRTTRSERREPMIEVL